MSTLTMQFDKYNGYLQIDCAVAHSVSTVCQCCFSWLQTSLNQRVICVLLDLTALVRAHMTETHDRVTTYNTSRAPRRGSGV